MKKKLLFVTLYLHTGGVEKSLLALLSSIDYNKYEVDLALFDHSGLLFNMVPKEVNVLPPIYKHFSSTLSVSVLGLLKERKFRLLTGKVLSTLLGKLSLNKGIGIRWSVFKNSISKIDKHYDVAISYFDFFSNYYVTEKISANKKIVYNHQDYEFSFRQGWGSKNLERRCFSKSNYIVSVSESAEESLKKFFPDISNKIKIINNISPIETVKKMSEEEGYTDSFDGIRIATVARLAEEKGIWLALEACYLLVQQQYNIRWYIVGNGVLRKKVESKIYELGLEDRFILLGEKLNPYPFIKNCDVYVQPSLTEAHCIAVEEAKNLHCPIIVTDIPSFKKQIIDEETGVIAQLSPKGLEKSLCKLINSTELRSRLSNNLRNNQHDNQEEIDKFLELVEI
ncbi:glycosyltransferase [Bacillus sp. ISL-18]|uniref:glycosyltransferase n=1 Tax=Bacillus sp. ISL-18 TaxID=2819118 RepID=UPI001BE5E570|nr:glycosyltransferase [Bacillus sp. ISL-18]MBT2657085.1 glycosyltransferase [Bacillus sp. ISL-18]